MRCRGAAGSIVPRRGRLRKENRLPEEDPGAGKAPRRAAYGRAAIGEPMTRIAMRRSQRTKRASGRETGISMRTGGTRGGQASRGRDTNFTWAMRWARSGVDFMAAIIGVGALLRRGRKRRVKCGIFGNPD